MRNHSDIVLIACYELGHQPLNLALPLAFLERAGFQPLAVDTSVETLSDATIEAARWVAISVPMHTATRLGVTIAERVRRLNPTAHITFFGLYAGLNATLLLPDKGDSVVAGEAEQPLVEIAEALEAGRSIADVNGASMVGQTVVPYLRKLEFTAPQRATLPDLTHYAHFRTGEETMLAGSVEASRGCLHVCYHCPITPVYGGRFFIVPRDVVLDDIRVQVQAGARHITFGDPDFLNGPRHSMAIVREMHREFPDLTFDATIKIEHVLEHRDLFPELHELGCTFIVSAVEAFSDPVLEKLAKGHTARDIEEALRITRDAGIVLRPSFVAFTPWTTLNDYVEMLDKVEAYDMVEQIDPVQYTIRLLVPPHSALLDQPDTVEWLGALDAAAFTYRWAHPDPKVDALYRDVSVLVEKDVSNGESLVDTFNHLKELVYAAAGLVCTAACCSSATSGKVLPGLTEAWFCCAEPMTIQLDALKVNQR